MDVGSLRNKSSVLLNGKSYGILGAGVSGRGAARLLQSLDRAVALFDDNDLSDEEEIKALVGKGAKTHFGKLNAEQAHASMDGIDALIVSPGIPESHPIKVESKKRNLPQAGEIELAWLKSGASKVAAITGTNGKTTVTMLVRHICEVAGMRAVETGNIGFSFSDAVIEAAENLSERMFSVEVSSFQLDDIQYFAPDVSILLNITPDHLDRHGSMEAYAKAKSRVTINQSPSQVLVINQDDVECLKIGHESRAQIMKFSLLRPVDNGAWLDDDQLMLITNGGKPKTLTQLDKIKLFGLHNVSNCLAAACAATALGVPLKKITEAIESFEAADHRLQPVATINGVTYVNDSKATNIDAMVKAVTSFSAPVHLIAGGRDKDSPFASVLSSLEGRVARAYLIGEAADKMEAAWGKSIPFSQCGTMANALTEAMDKAADGEIVLLAPGCASFDQFKNYKDRGEHFIRWVREKKGAEVAV